ncbi:MarR family transcriptional regulator [Actinoplanes sp. NPDC051851]|uniref:MarR family winged helix-turn-helix transcriptional regulator n=1 Tax=Actinoplanes sp. NPDC051851 TaxID=3154753 RepID=UPI00343C7FD7
MSDDTPWLSEDELLAWLHLVGVLTTLPAAIDAQLKRDASVNFFEYSILSVLSVRPRRSMQMATLAVLTNGSQSRLSHAVSRLERAGWVDRRQCPGTDPRHVEAVLTDAGMAKVVEIAPGHVREVRRTVIDPLTSEDVAQLRTVCEKILKATGPAVLDTIDETRR